MTTNFSSEGGFEVEVSGSSERFADHILLSLPMLLEGTHHRGEVRSCYISHRFANDRHNHFRGFNGAQREWSSSTSSQIVAGDTESSSEYHHRSGDVSGQHAVVNHGPELGATKDQSTTAGAYCRASTTSLFNQPIDVDLAHRLQTCHICDLNLPSSSETSLDGMEQDVPQDHSHGHPLQRHQNPQWLGHYHSEKKT